LKPHRCLEKFSYCGSDFPTQFSGKQNGIDKNPREVPMKIMGGNKSVLKPEKIFSKSYRKKR